MYYLVNCSTDKIIIWGHLIVSVCRWKWSHTCWTTSCAMSARELAAAGSLHRSSAPTSPASSTTASTAGRPSTHVPDESFTNPWWRREATDPVTSPSAGTEQMVAMERQQGSRRAGSAGVANHCTNKCTFLLLVPFCSNFTEHFFLIF